MALTTREAKGLFKNGKCGKKEGGERNGIVPVRRLLYFLSSFLSIRYFSHTAKTISLIVYFIDFY